MFSFWKPKALTKPLLQAELAIPVSSTPILNKLEKIQKKLIDANSDQERVKQADNRCRAALFVTSLAGCGGVIALTTLIINKYLQAAQGEVRFNNEIRFENKTCEEIMRYKYQSDELCSLEGNQNLPMVDDYYAIRACFPVFQEMCANEYYGWVILCTIALALLSAGFFIGNMHWESCYFDNVLSNAEKNFLKNFKISENKSEQEKLERIDKILQTKIDAPLPMPLMSLVDEYLTRGNEDIFAKVAIESMRPRLR